MGKKREYVKDNLLTKRKLLGSQRERIIAE